MRMISNKQLLLISSCGIILFIIILYRVNGKFPCKESYHKENDVKFNNIQRIEKSDNEVSGVKENDISCYEEESTGSSLPLFHASEVKDDRNIFFHETSCFGNSDAFLKARQACAVESAAKMNPNMTVYLLILTPSRFSGHSQTLIESITKYDNVKLRRLLVRDYFIGTPLENWYIQNRLKTSKWPSIHMSDYLRYLTLWKFGGIYLDLDVVIMKSLQNLTDFVGVQDWKDIAAGAMSLTRSNIGREVARDCMEDLKSNFRGNVWANSGPGVITRTLKKICNVHSLKEMTVEKCKGVKVFPPKAFYPFYYTKWKRYFESTNLERNMKEIKDSYAIHVWNKMSKDTKIRIGERVPYTVVAEQYCPLVYKQSGTYF